MVTPQAKPEQGDLAHYSEMSGDFGLIAGNGLELHYHNVVRKGKRDGTKVERSVETRYGEIKASKN